MRSILKGSLHEIKVRWGMINIHESPSTPFLSPNDEGELNAKRHFPRGIYKETQNIIGVSKNASRATKWSLISGNQDGL